VNEDFPVIHLRMIACKLHGEFPPICKTSRLKYWIISGRLCRPMYVINDVDIFLGNNDCLPSKCLRINLIPSLTLDMRCSFAFAFMLLSSHICKTFNTYDISYEIIT